MSDRGRLTETKSQNVLPVTLRLAMTARDLRRSELRQTALDTGDSHGGDGWHSSGMRNMLVVLDVQRALAKMTEEMANLAHPLDEPKSFEKVEQGHAVMLLSDESTGTESQRTIFHVVSPTDSTVLSEPLRQLAEFADRSNRLVSIESPLGAALIDKRVGDPVEYETPGGRRAAVVGAIGRSALFDLEL